MKEEHLEILFTLMHDMKEDLNISKRILVEIRDEIKNLNNPLVEVKDEIAGLHDPLNDIKHNDYSSNVEFELKELKELLKSVISEGKVVTTNYHN